VGEVSAEAGDHGMLGEPQLLFDRQRLAQVLFRF
jgi:hypothetical protein